MREALNALLYITASGCAWWLLPECFRRSLQFSAISILGARGPALGNERGAGHDLREIGGREASPSDGVIDSQSAPPEKLQAEGCMA